MVAKLEGPFHWHKHDDTDDLFLVLAGTLDIELRDRIVTRNPGEVFVVPKGVEHRPVARGEVHILLIEPTGTPNTGDKATPRRASSPEARRIGAHGFTSLSGSRASSAAATSIGLPFRSTRAGIRRQII